MVIDTASHNMQPQDMSEDTVASNEYGREFYVSEEADDRIYDSYYRISRI